MKANSIVAIVVVGAVALAAVFYVFVHWHQTLDIKMGTEIFKATYGSLIQFFLITVLGGFVAYLYTIDGKKREQDAANFSQGSQGKGATGSGACQGKR